MRRSLVAGAIGLALVGAACVSVTPGGSPTLAPTPTPTASPSPTASPTQAPTASPTAAPTAVPTLAPTASPTLSLTEPPTLAPTGTPSLPTGSPSTGTGFGADTLIFTDDFSDTTSTAWGTGDLDEGTIQYASGGIVITLTQDGSSLWSWHSPGDAWNTMRLEGRVVLSDADGSAGLACGDVSTDFVGGRVTNSDEWEFFQIVANSATPLDSGPLPGTVVATSPYQMVVECAGTATGAIRLHMTLDGHEVATYEGPAGPASFDRPAIFAETQVAGFTATFDDISAYGGTEFGGFLPVVDQAAVDDLLTHIPDAFEANCAPFTSDQAGQLAQIRCEPAGSAGQAGYASYADTASMDAAYDDAIDGWDVPEGGSCADGPNSGTYTINDIDAGRVACNVNEAEGGIAIVWTDTQLNILSAGIMGGEDYAALFDWWENEAGPDR